MNFKPLARTAVVAALLLSTAAHADTIVRKDPVHGFTMSFPDSWTVQTDDTAHTRLRIAGPLAEDRPTCRMKVQEDGRALIYPKEQVDEYVSETFPPDFWQGEVGKHENAVVTDFMDPAGLGGKGDATGVRFTFVENDGAGPAPMTGIMFASLYAGKRYTASCSAKSAVFEKWEDVFGSVLGSVELDSRYHPFATGYYRDFLSDPKLNLPRSKPGTTKVKNNLSLWDRLFGRDKYHR